ncbi:response regulator transcription factor [Nocardiopsis sp. NPDC058631]|uniref:response regulator transcription factor n=1 Tax=Nocardiopsis sp. NPDC058631 TaxID=3346566 RepID=UPI0036517F9C
MSGNYGIPKGPEAFAPGLREEHFAQLADTRVIVAIANGVLRQGMRTLLEELPLGRLHSCPTLQDAEFGATELPRSVLILAEGESSPAEWTVIPPEFKTLVLLAKPSGIDSLDRHSQTDGLLLQEELNVPLLGDALSRVLSGQFPLPSAVARRLMTQGIIQRTTLTRAAQLTERQHETLRLLSEGLSNRQIGHRLRISEHGAKRLVASVLTKLDTPNRAGAVAVGLREGLLP